MLLLRTAARQQRQQGRLRLLALPSIPHARPLTATAASTASVPAGHRAEQPNHKPSRSGPVDFGDTAAAYSSLKTLDLVRAYLVFRACGLRPLVTHADAVLRNVRTRARVCVFCWVGCARRYIPITLPTPCTPTPTHTVVPLPGQGPDGGADQGKHESSSTPPTDRRPLPPTHSSLKHQHHTHNHTLIRPPSSGTSARGRRRRASARAWHSCGRAAWAVSWTMRPRWEVVCVWMGLAVLA